jgi:hypothetical protein
MPAGKVKFQDIGEYGSLSHGVVSWYVGDDETVFLLPTNYTFLFNELNLLSRTVRPSQLSRDLAIGN